MEHPSYFELLHENSEFRLFKRIFTEPSFYGPFDIGISINTIDTSLSGIIPTDLVMTNPPIGYVDLDLAALDIPMVNISLSYNISLDNEEIMFSKFIPFIPISSNPIRIDWEFSLNTSFSWKNLEVNITYTSTQNETMIESWRYATEPSIEFTKETDAFLLTKGPGLKIQI